MEGTPPCLIRMSEVVDRLLSIDSAEALSTCISECMPDLYELYNSDWETLCTDRDEISELIMFKHSLISMLNFENQENRAFVLICLDVAERLNLQSALPHLVRITNKHSEQIHLNKRLLAGVSYIYPRPHTADDIIEKYSHICSLLQQAIETEEDDNKKCLITFLSYYSAALDQLSADYANELRMRIASSIRTSEYPFLGDIQGLNDVNTSNPIQAQDQIQAIIDAIIQESVVRSRPSPTDEFIIEEDTQYSRDIQSVPCRFRSIKRLSDDRASGNGIVGRGVQQIQSEDGLFDYMRNYGNMHQAKVKSALDSPFPQQFDTQVSLVDWGCGQGLASMVFLDKYGSANIKQIILIEPSEIALKRAALHCKKYAPNVPLQTICKEFDELTPEDIHLVEPETTVHLFSNVLDMDSYSVEHLANLVKQLPQAQQYYVCISPHIDDIRTNKIDTFVRLMQQGNSDFNMLNSKTNTKYNEFWNCNNMEMGRSAHHGGTPYCRDFSGEPCSSRWTRVMRVFQA
mgnify:CR=1 FL=1